MTKPDSIAKLTPAKKRALQWALREGQVSQWPVAVCSLATVRKCVDDGLLENCGTEPGRFGFVVYRLTAAGHAALA